MKKLLLLGTLGCFSVCLRAQRVEVRNPDVLPLTYQGTTVPLRDYIEDPNAVNEITRGLKLGVQPKHDWPLHPKVNPRALPLGMDPALQQEYNAAPDNRAVLFNFEGMGYTNLNPPDPSLDVGPSHVIQMINGGSGAQFQIWDKDGNSLIGPTLLDNFMGFPGGAGDPIVLYDQLADRWLMSEFAGEGNYLHIAISTSPDPLGTWYTYVFDTPDFPDYPKYAVWPDAYYVTTNESDPAVYAMDRIKMLAGDTSATAQRFTIPSVPALSFQTATPVDLEGDLVPPANAPGMIMRMVDDGWSMSITADYLEIWEFAVDFATPANSMLSGPDTLHTQPFDSELCGYTGFSCIVQEDSPGPGPPSPELDPLREVLMNRIHYRNFGSHESIVCNHVTDVDGNDKAGVRWYELRRTSDWSVYQQGTYSPNAENRWMAAIAMDAEGNIGLAYNVAGVGTWPSLRYTGRAQCDTLGMMTVPETSIVAGADANPSSRYGDYSTMSVDPTTGQFWFTGEYNPTDEWSTRITAFDPKTCIPSVSFDQATTAAFEAEADMDSACLGYKDYAVRVKVAMPPSQPVDVSYTIVGQSGTPGNAGDYAVFPSMITLSGANMLDSFTVRVFDDAYVEGKDTLLLGYTLDAHGGDAVAGFYNQTHFVTITDDDQEPVSGATDDILIADFTPGAQSFTTTNPSGDDPWALGTNVDASSSAWEVPDNGSGQLFFVNDDDCNCDMEVVRLITPAIDLSTSNGSFITFDSYFLGNTYQGNTESAELEVSVDDGPFVAVPGGNVSGADVWQSLQYDLSPYDGLGNVRIAFTYSDGTGWLYGWAVDNVTISGAVPVAVQTDADTLMPAVAYLGPFETAQFYDPSSGNIIATIENTSAADFGCTTVEVDRQGSVPDALPFTSNDTSTYLCSKTIKVSPEHDVEGMYNITLYYQSDEVSTWNLVTGHTADDASIIKVSGDHSIGEVTPENYESFTVHIGTTAYGDYGGDTSFTASFSGGFSGFGVGRRCDLLVTNTTNAAEGSLRAALACAKDGDTIRFDANIFNDTITLLDAPLLLDNDVVLLSSITENITINASNISRAIVVAADVNAQIIGTRVLSGSDVEGRGVFNQGTVLIRDVTVIDHPSAGIGKIVTNQGILVIQGESNVDE